jgi:hypothetical protein
MLSMHGEAIHRGDAPFLLIFNHNEVQFIGTFIHDYNDKCTMVSKGILEDFTTFF